MATSRNQSLFILQVLLLCKKMNCQNEHHSHSHGRDSHDDSDHIAPPDTYESQSLYNHIYHDHIRVLNESQQDSGKSIFKPWEKRLDVTSVSIISLLLILIF